jgi:hypothetical protein
MIQSLAAVCLIDLGRILKVRTSCSQLPAIELCTVGIDSSLSDNFGRSIIYGLSVITTLITISFVGGLPFIFAAGVLGIIYYKGRAPRS